MNYELYEKMLAKGFDEEDMSALNGSMSGWSPEHSEGHPFQRVISHFNAQEISKNTLKKVEALNASDFCLLLEEIAGFWGRKDMLTYIVPMDEAYARFYRAYDDKEECQRKIDAYLSTFYSEKNMVKDCV